jgi:hypothetical protein
MWSALSNLLDLYTVLYTAKNFIVIIKLWFWGQQQIIITFCTSIFQI